MDRRKKPITFILDLENPDALEVKKRIKGQVRLFPHANMEVKRIGYKLILEIRGLLERDEYDLFDNQLTGPTHLSRDEKYVFDLSFYNDRHRGYKGKNISYLFKLQVYVIADLENKNNEKRGFFYELTRNKSDGSIIMDEYLDFKGLESYELHTSEIDLVQASFVRTVLGWVFSMCIFSFFIRDMDFFQTYKQGIYVIGAVLLFLAVFYYLLDKVLIGKIDAKVQNIGANELGFNLRNRWTLVDYVHVQYQIVEEVEDKRGTSVKILRHICYQSETRNVKCKGKTVTALFNYPEDAMPTIRYEDSRIYWRLQVKASTSIGIPFTHRGEFNVSKVRGKE